VSGNKKRKLSGINYFRLATVGDEQRLCGRFYATSAAANKGRMRETAGLQRSVLNEGVNRRRRATSPPTQPPRPLRRAGVTRVLGARRTKNNEVRSPPNWEGVPMEPEHKMQCN